MNDRAKTFMLASIFLQYPEEKWLKKRVLKKEVEALNDYTIRTKFLEFLSYLESENLENLALNYVNTFDFNEKTTLYLTYSIFGEERERGKALLELKEQYSLAGYIFTEKELPDYLPAIYEFLAIAQEEIAVKVLAKYEDAIRELYKELLAISSPYQLVLGATLNILEQEKQAKVGGLL